DLFRQLAGYLETRAAPADLDRALRAVDRDVGLAGGRQAPAEVDPADQAAARGDQDGGGVLDLDALELLQAGRLHPAHRAEEKGDDVKGVTAVVDDHATAGEGAMTVPAPAHVDHAREVDLEGHR